MPPTTASWPRAARRGLMPKASFTSHAGRRRLRPAHAAEMAGMYQLERRLVSIIEPARRDRPDARLPVLVGLACLARHPGRGRRRSGELLVRAAGPLPGKTNRHGLVLRSVRGFRAGRRAFDGGKACGAGLPGAGRPGKCGRALHGRKRHRFADAFDRAGDCRKTAVFAPARSRPERGASRHDGRSGKPGSPATRFCAANTPTMTGSCRGEVRKHGSGPPRLPRRPDLSCRPVPTPLRASASARRTGLETFPGWSGVVPPTGSPVSTSQGPLVLSWSIDVGEK